ncbi:MAG: hypothetical protein HYW48_10335 [Deltaproteobacteria bacterium]|nr:hypothetical protein [Deltaproteobacteria bacterium]
MRRTFAVRVLCLFCFAIFSSVSLAADAFSVYRGASSLGRGHAGLAGSEDVDAIFYNPAALLANKEEENRERLVLFSPMPEVSRNISSVIAKVQDDSDSEKVSLVDDLVKTPLFVGFSNFSGIIANRFAIGIVTSAFARAFAFKDLEFSGLETVDFKAFTNLGLITSYAHDVYEGVWVGGTLKYLDRTQVTASLNLSDIKEIKELSIDNYRNKGKGYGLDVGSIYRPPLLQGESYRTQFALTVDDVGETQFAKTEKDGPPLESIKQTINLGATFAWLWDGTKLTFHGDYRDLLSNNETNSFKNLHLGLDFSLAEKVGLALGLNQGYPTASVFFGGKFVRLYIGSYGEEQGKKVGDRPDVRFFTRLSLSV